MSSDAHIFTRDIETRSIVDLKKVGLHNYATHPSTEILTIGYCIDDAPVQFWHRGDPIPKDYITAARHGFTVTAHNAPFEMAIERHILHVRYKFPIIPIDRNICTMAIANALALPASLGRLAKALNFKHQKDVTGNRLMLQMSKPRKPRKNEDPKGVYWFDDDERMRKLDFYCGGDVEVAREAANKLPWLSDDEYQVWLLDQKINNRGIHIDHELALAARQIVEAVEPHIDREIAKITNGQITSITQVAKLKVWLAQYVEDIDSLDKKAIEQLLSRDLPEHVLRAIELRYLGAQAATKKVDALLAHRNSTGRVYDAFVYHAAGPGRWSSRGIQLHNMKRSATEDIEKAVEIIGRGDFDAAREAYDNPLAVIGDLIRAMIIAAPGHMLIGADFSGIEARITAWLANETRKLELFRAFDAGKSPDPYLVAAALIFNLDLAKLATDFKAGKPQAREQRQVGKACLAADTKVVTNAGVKRIVDVQKSDLLWDGDQWVHHDGLVNKGKRQTINLFGIRLTPDHLVLVDRANAIWRRADELASNASMRYLALDTGMASLKSLKSNEGLLAVSKPSGSNALAALDHTQFTLPAYFSAVRHDVTPAPRKRRGAGVRRNTGNMRQSFQTSSIDAACLIASHPASVDAMSQLMLDSKTMVAEAYAFVDRGTEIANLSWPILSRLMGGIIPHLKSIVSKITKATSRATYASLAKAKTTAIKNVYDLANAGPNHRFTVVTESGSLLVHNSELAFGFQGGLNAYLKFDPNTTFSDEEIHRFKNAWRKAHPNIVLMWRDLNNAMWMATRKVGQRVRYRDTLTFLHDGHTLWITLPSGRKLSYPECRIRRIIQPEDSGLVIVSLKGKPALIFKDNALGQWRDVVVYGGLITENVVQAIARDLLAQAMLRLDAIKLDIVAHVHDEAIIEVLKNLVKKILPIFHRLMVESPDWATGLPIVAKAWSAPRYVK